MKRILFTLLLTATVASTASAQIPFSARADSVKLFFENLETNKNYCSSLAMILSEKKREQGLGMLDTLLSAPEVTAIARFRMTALFMYAKDILPAEYVSTIHELWELIPLLPPREEYEKVLYYTSFLLTCEHSSSTQKWFNGRSTSENTEDARAYLHHWIHETAFNGQQLYDSPTYAPAMIVSMQLLGRFCTDSELKAKANAMVSWMLADFAVDYLEGQYTGSHGKESNQSAMFPLISDMSQFGWLYFGDGFQIYGLEQYFAALSGYEPPAEIVTLALDRKKAYESYERKRSADRIRGADVPNYPIEKYTYMTPLYAVGSIPGGLNSAGEQHSWDVTWVTRDRNSTLFSMHPYASADAIAQFLPYPTQTSYRFYSASDQYYNTGSKSVGGSPYESIFQHKNTVIALYDIPEELPRFGFYTTYMPIHPKSFDIDSNKTGWITMDVGDVYIAMYPLKQYNIFPEAKEGRFQRLYSRGGKNGLVVQVAGKNEVGAYKTFRKKIRKSKVDDSRFDSDGIIQYNTIFGDTLTATYQKGGMVNGTAPAFPKDMLFSAPRISSVLGSGIMTVTGKKYELVIDVGKGTVEQQEIRK